MCPEEKSEEATETADASAPGAIEESTTAPPVDTSPELPVAEIAAVVATGAIASSSADVDEQRRARCRKFSHG